MLNFHGKYFNLFIYFSKKNQFSDPNLVWQIIINLSKLRRFSELDFVAYATPFTM